MASRQIDHLQALPSWFKYVYRFFILLIWGSVFVVCLRYKDAITVDNIIKNTPGNQFAAFIVIVALFAVKSASIFIYCGIIYIASGLIFPFPLAMLANICGSIVMFSLPYFVGKRLGSDVVRYFSRKYPKIEYIKRLRSNQDFKFTLLVRIIGILPLDLVSLYMGAIRINYLQYLLGSILAFVPTMILLSIMGKNAVDPGSPQFILAACFEMLYILASGVLCYVTLKNNTRKTSKAE